jgi:hypothetical protein
MINGFAVPITIVFRESINEKPLHELMATEHVVSVVLHRPNESFATCYPGRVGWYHLNEAGWTLPRRLASEILYVGNLSSFGFRAAWSAWRAGIQGFRSSDPSGSFHKCMMLSEVIRAFLRALAHRPPVKKVVDLYSRIRRKGVAKQLFEHKKTAYQPNPGSILLASGSLGPGGSERQVVNTLLGLKVKGYCNLMFLHEQPMQHPNDFYLSNLINAGIQFSQLIPLESRRIDSWSTDSDWVELYRRLLPLGSVGNQILAYGLEFQERRPELVHSWLDHVNVTAGVAAAIVGVPRVVISCRSLAPIHFTSPI